MPQNIIRLLIADDNEEICDLLENFFRFVPEIEVCGVTNDGTQTLKSIYSVKPDVVLLDVIMPELDGIDVLKRLKQAPPERCPKIIMISAIGQENITREAFSLGASYYSLKPFDLDLLKEKILNAFYYDPIEDNQNRKECCKEGLESDIRKTVMQVGIPTNILGYKYIVEAIEIMLEDRYVGNLAQNIYEKISYNNGTTPQCVESAIRNAIKRASDMNNDNFKALFEGKILSNKTKPSNTMFITRIAESIKLM